MSERDPDVHANDLAAESLAADDPTGWFERLYAEAEEGRAVVPWNRREPHPLFVQWAQSRGLEGDGRQALVVGFGLGYDAEYVAARGFNTVAFDVSATAVEAARRRFPESPVNYVTADLLDPPPEWRQAFDLVVEIITVQALPQSVRPGAIAAVAGFVAPGGTLFTVSGMRDEDEEVEGPPWPLSRPEVESFARHGLETVALADPPMPAQPGARRWLAVFERPR